MSVLSDSEEWKNNPWFQIHGPQPSDYTSFYVGISFCTIIVFSLVILNLICCCCSPFKEYWRDPNTGNRYVLTKL